jgi:hypothetical protein
MGVCSSSNKHKDRHVHRISTMSDNVDKTIIQCKITRDNIRSYIKRLEKNEKLKKEKAKESLKNKDRERAKMYLSQSKMYREQIVSANGQLNLIEDQIMQVETARQQRDAVRVLEQGNSVLKKLYEEVNVEKFEKIADDMSQLKEQQDQIGDFLKSKGISQEDYDESVEKELENLMKVESHEIESEFPQPGERSVIVLKPVEKLKTLEQHDGVIIEN